MLSLKLEHYLYVSEIYVLRFLTFFVIWHIKKVGELRFIDAHLLLVGLNFPNISGWKI